MRALKPKDNGMNYKTNPPAGSIDPDWKWSYAAGYSDPAGHYAGGSEIMHLAPHKGRLYAANGYWKMGSENGVKSTFDPCE